MTSAIEKRAFTVATLAKAWDCSEGIIRRMIAEGRLNVFRIGNLIRIRPDEVERFERQDTAPDAGSNDEIDGMLSDEPRRLNIPRASLGSRKPIRRAP